MNRRTSDGPAGTAYGLVSFDLGLGLAAAVFLVALPAPGALLGLLSASGLAAVCVLVMAVMPCSLMTLHGRVMAADCPEGYRKAASLAVRIVGVVLVLGMWFLVPYHLGKLLPEHEWFDDSLFVLGCLAILAGTLAAFGNRGAALALGGGAVLLGVLFSLPADLATWREGTGRGPVVGVAAGAVALAVLVFVGRFVGNLDALSGRLDAWLARPNGERAARVLAPFLAALAFSLWSAIYGELAVRDLPRFQAVLALVAMGVVPYRLLLALAPPLRPLPALTGLAATGAWLAGMLR
jgi:hypothetical protein